MGCFAIPKFSLHGSTVKVESMDSVGLIKMLKQRMINGIVQHCEQNGIHLVSMCIGTLQLILGYSIKDLQTHLKVSSVNDLLGMEIDHIHPKFKVKFKSIRDPNFIECWSLKNIQLITKEENRKKSFNGGDLCRKEKN